MRQGSCRLQILISLILLASSVACQNRTEETSGIGDSSKHPPVAESALAARGRHTAVPPVAVDGGTSTRLTTSEGGSEKRALANGVEQEPRRISQDGIPESGPESSSEGPQVGDDSSVTPEEQPTPAAQPPEVPAATKEPSAAEVKEREEDEEEDRHNFALAKDGAKVISANKEAKKTGAVLDSDGDTFLKNECKADKWLIVELSQVTKMDTLLIAQNELYSSRMKEFEVRGRQSHPRTEGSDYSKTLNSSQWQFLGRFEASNVKGTQAFKLENPSWLKYLQIRQLSHHGTEAVCALNDVCVYGKSAAEDLEDRLSQESRLEESEVPVPPLDIPEVGLKLPVIPLDGVPVVVEPVPLPGSIGDNGSMGLPVAGSGGAAIGDVAGVFEKAATPTEPIKVVVEEPDLHPEPTPRPAQMPEPGGDAPPKLPSEEASESGMSEKGKPAVEAESAGEAPSPTDPRSGTGANGHGGSGGGGVGGGGSKAEDQLPANSAGSAASRHGGSVYDIIVQELKAIKLAQKDGARNLTQLQVNTSVVLGRLALEVDLLTHRMNRLDPPVQALLPPQGGGAPMVAGQRCAAKEGEGLDFREAGQCKIPEAKPFVQAPTELEVLQQEVARLQGAVARFKRQADALLLALAFSFVGGLVASTALFLGSISRLLRGTLLLLGAAPPALVAWLWLTRT